MRIALIADSRAIFTFSNSMIFAETREIWKIRKNVWSGNGGKVTSLGATCGRAYGHMDRFSHFETNEVIRPTRKEEKSRQKQQLLARRSAQHDSLSTKKHIKNET